jgi:hypothetical protein
MADPLTAAIVAVSSVMGGAVVLGAKSVGGAIISALFKRDHSPTTPPAPAPAPHDVAALAAEVDALRASVEAAGRAADANARTIARVDRKIEDASALEAEFRAEVRDGIVAIQQRIRQQKRSP